MPLLTQDRALLDAFRRREPEALTRVYRHYAPILLAHLRRGLRIEAGELSLRAEASGFYEVEAVLQETFARAFSPRTIESYDGLRPYTTFLLGVARNILLDEYRRHRRALARFVPLESGDSTSPVDTGELPAAEALEAEEARQLVVQFLATCSEVERAVYAARYEEELTQEEAARRAGISRMKLRRVDEKLRARFLKFAEKRGFLDREPARPLPVGGKLWSLLC